MNNYSLLQYSHELVCSFAQAETQFLCKAKLFCEMFWTVHFGNINTVCSLEKKMQLCGQAWSLYVYRYNNFCLEKLLSRAPIVILILGGKSKNCFGLIILHTYLSFIQSTTLFLHMREYVNHPFNFAQLQQVICF